MRNLTLLVLSLVLVVPPVVKAQEGDAGEKATAHIPKSSPFCIRVKSLDRIDAIAKEFVPILKAFGAPREAAMLESAPASSLIFMQAGMDATSVDKAKPVYMGMTMKDGREEPVILFHPAAAWEGDKALKDGAVARVKDGIGLAGPATALDAETRGAPTRTLAGDAVIHVYLGNLIAQNREDIENMFAQAAMQAAGADGLNESARAVVPHLISGCKDALYSVESLDYALTWKDGSFEAEGLLRTKPRSALRALLQRAGKPGNAADLAGYLPKDAIFAYTGVVTPDWPLKELSGMIQKAVGEGPGGAVVKMFGAMLPLAQNMTGRSATAMTMTGMMGFGVTSVAELKEGVDPKALFAKYNVEDMNAAIAKFGIPIKYQLDKAIAKHGETELHRMMMTSDNPQLGAMAAMTQTYMAADKGHLFVVMSPTAEDDIKGLIDQVRAGERIEHPHTKAMATLGRAHNIGFSFNLGALKPLAMMVGMFGAPPEVAQAMQNIPDDMVLATAITLSDGDIHWRGNWPVKQVAKIVEAMQPAGGGAAAPDEEFD